VILRERTAAIAVIALLSALVVLLIDAQTVSHRATAAGSPPPPSTAPAVATAPSDAPLILSTGRQLSVGVTLAQASANPWGNPAAVASAKGILATQPLLQAQSIMGWGVGNPEPSPGVYDWSGLDQRMALIRSTSGTPVITLCGAPDWMAGYPAGETDWKRLGEAPTPAHYADFAALAAQVALRYPYVHYFQVWNELTGFWDADDEQWNAAGYTEMYNDVYEAIKAVEPSAQIGGPYVVMTSSTEPATDQPAAPSPADGSITGPWGTVDPRALDVVVYWLAHAVGADFVSVDADSEPTSGSPTTDEFTATEKFAAIDAWLRQRTKLPVWWSEFYVEPARGNWTPAHQAAVLTTAMARMASSGASVAMLWGPEANGQGGLLGYLWTNTTLPGGGKATPLAVSIDAFDAAVRRGGTQVIINPNNRAVPSPTGGQGGGDPTLAPYEVSYEAGHETSG
jgi:hypothetical protein